MSSPEARSPETDELETKLAGFIRSYIYSTDPSQKEEALRWVCAGLEWLLGTLLNGRTGWSGWVDGILPATDMLPDAIEVISPGALSIRGCALWAKNTARSPLSHFMRQFKSPMRQQIRLSATI